MTGALAVRFSVCVAQSTPEHSIFNFLAQISDLQAVLKQTLSKHLQEHNRSNALQSETYCRILQVLLRVKYQNVYIPRKLILYLVISGLFLLFLGLGLILLYNTYEDQHPYIRPLIVIGKKINCSPVFTSSITGVTYFRASPHWGQSLYNHVFHRNMSSVSFYHKRFLVASLCSIC